MEWGDRLEAVREAAQEKGNIMSVKITLTGRPGHIVRREGTVVLAMESSVRHAYACRLSNSLANTVTRPAVPSADPTWIWEGGNALL